MVYKLECSSVSRSAYLSSLNDGRSWRMEVCRSRGSVDESEYVGYFGNLPSAYSTLRSFGALWTLCQGYPVPPFFEDSLGSEYDMVVI